MYRLPTSCDENDPSGVAPPFPAPTLPARASSTPCSPRLPAPVQTGAALREDTRKASSGSEEPRCDLVNWDEV